MSKIDWAALGRKIRSARKEAGYTQAQLAEEIGSYQPHISLAERGSPAGLSGEQIDELLSFLEISEQEFESDDQPSEQPAGTRVFISYSHKDRVFFDRLLVHLKPLERKELLDVWADTKIQAGDQWRQEIENALNEAKVAVLLVSADFLASDFIVDNELPPLLEGAEKKGTRILPVILKPCRFAREPKLSRFQAINPPSDPLLAMEEHNRELIFDAVAQSIESELSGSE